MEEGYKIYDSNNNNNSMKDKLSNKDSKQINLSYNDNPKEYNNNNNFKDNNKNDNLKEYNNNNT